VSTPPTNIEPGEGSEQALSDAELKTVAPEVLANTLGEYLSAWWRRIKGGESGALPVLVGLIAIGLFFEIENTEFLSDGNLVSLFGESALFIVLGAAETFVLLLSEIDLSLGYGVGVSGFVIAELIAPPVNLPWWLGIIGGVVAMGLFGLLQGTLITQLGLPSFIVTLGGQLGLLGIMLEIANVDSTAVGGVIQVNPSSPIYKLGSDSMSPSLGWIALAVCIALFAAITLNRNRSRRSRGLHTEPLGVTVLTIVGVTVAGVVLMYICNANRSNFAVIHGMPWVIPFVLIIILAYSWLLSRTRTGRYIYAVGNNPEAARRAGINVKWIVTFGFIMAGATAALAGVIYISQQGSVSTDIDGGTEVLYAVAAAVVGGTALFGGRGKMVNAMIGGFVISVVYNGLALMNVSSAVYDMAVAVVLIAAVSLDAIVRSRAVIR
jgi:D-xylose transport system permease protein